MAKKTKSSKGSGILIQGARENNLKNLSCEIPHEKIITITGLSGSGKSSLAFDTIYAEAQRRYIDSLSHYARQFLHQLKKPDVDVVTGLCPSISIDQKTISYNPRSTVGTITEVYDYLRLLFAKVGTPHCSVHGTPLKGQTSEEILNLVYKNSKKEKFYVLAPVAQGVKGEFLKESQKWMKQGFLKARVDGKWIELSKMKKLSKHKSHHIDLLVDQLVREEKFKRRLKESIELSFQVAQGLVKIETLNGKSHVYSLHNSCEICGESLSELEPRLFSFNSPHGACPSCHGLGVEDYDEEDVLFICEDCEGYRLNKKALNVLISDKHIGELQELSIVELLKFLKKIKCEGQNKLVAQSILKEIFSYLEYLIDVGVGYLSLGRTSETLSGGEGQRIRLASQLGSSLIGVLYVLDEPSIGLHPKDHLKLISILKEIQKRGNTILLVEHDQDTILSSDLVLDLGPGAGRLGGEIIAQGSVSEIKKNPKSLTGQYLSGKKRVDISSSRRSFSKTLELKGASGNNLKNVNVKIPLGVLLGVTGVSGSGKSTLIRETLYKALQQELNGSKDSGEEYKSLKGMESVHRVVEINQKPIGRTPRSIPSTYTNIFPLVRQLFSALPESRMKGYKPGYFSFNVPGGRCEKCQGMGKIKMTMNSFSNVYVDCELCQGRRYHSEALQIRYKNKSIYDVLKMTVNEALEFFEHHKLIQNNLKTLKQVGLGYIQLGQNSTTLSGGEAQRVKLSRELSKQSTKNTVYILDEPTTGLHFHDIKKLVALLDELVQQGNTVIVIEHNLDVLKNCDFLLELGPQGGEQGGELIASGTPEDLIKNKKSVIAPFLKRSY